MGQQAVLPCHLQQAANISFAAASTTRTETFIMSLEEGVYSMSEEKLRIGAAAAEEQKAEIKESGETSGKEEKEEKRRPEVSSTWAEETIQDLDEFIESQGIYIRQ